MLTVSFCFSIFNANLVIVKFIIYPILLACNFYIDNCIVFQLLFSEINVVHTLCYSFREMNHRKGSYFFMRKESDLEWSSPINLKKQLLMVFKCSSCSGKFQHIHQIQVKKNFIAPSYGWGSSTWRLEPLQGGSLPFTTKFLVLILSTSEG